MKNRIRIVCLILCITMVIGFVPMDGAKREVAASSFFSDVLNDKDFWFTPAYWGASNGVVEGYSDGTFRPGNQCTRAQMVTFIWRIAGKPEPTGDTCPFSDIKQSDYWYKAALWGNENHIVEGYKDGTFRAQNLCTRKQAVTFLWRFAGKPEPKEGAGKFSDIKKSDYFYKAVLWASQKGIVAGYKDGTFKPSGDCLRRQMVTFLYKFCKSVVKGKVEPLSFDKSITLDTDIDYDAIDQAKLITPTPTPKPWKMDKKHGSAVTPEGKILLVSIYADEKNYSWNYKSEEDQALIDGSIGKLKYATDYITEEVGKYGKDVTFVYDWKDYGDLVYYADFDEDIINLGDGWYDAQDSWIDKNIKTEKIMNKYQADGIIYMFFFNTPYENTVNPCSINHSQGDYVLYEYTNIYMKHDCYDVLTASLAHEILHSFGAHDLYYANRWIPQSYVDECKNTGSNDIMYTVTVSDKVINDFTDLDAYYVGIAPRPSWADKWSLGKSEHE